MLTLLRAVYPLRVFATLRLHLSPPHYEPADVAVIQDAIDLKSGEPQSKAAAASAGE